MVAAGAAASMDRPLAWLRMEPDGKPGHAAVLPSQWPGGMEREPGRADYHGRWVEWH